jgi:chemotaxis protein MotB
MARRKRKHPEHVNHERWLVSYADFITLLFAFFTTLYAISTVDQRKAGKLMYSMRTAFNMEFFKGVPGTGSTSLVTIVETLANALPADKSAVAGPGEGQGGPGKDRMAALSRKLGELSVDPMLRGKIQIRMEARGLVVSLAEAGFFASGSAGVRADAVEPLLALARTFDDQGFRVTVEGHTDNVPVRNGKFSSNWELSTARASTVIALLIEKGGIPPTRLSAAGYGEFKPVGPNDSDEGRARNRRVDIVISPATTDVDASRAAPEMPTAPPGGRGN